jgi:hypothetical protein
MDKATIELLARRAGLEKALAGHPEDVPLPPHRQAMRWHG